MISSAKIAGCRLHKTRQSSAIWSVEDFLSFWTFFQNKHFTSIADVHYLEKNKIIIMPLAYILFYALQPLNWVVHVSLILIWVALVQIRG